MAFWIFCDPSLSLKGAVSPTPNQSPAFERKHDMFKNGRGFSMTFQNGWTVSVQWHDGAYSDKNNATAEVAAWNKHGEWFDFGHDTVQGWQTPEEVVEFFNMIKELGDEQSSYLDNDREARELQSN